MAVSLLSSYRLLLLPSLCLCLSVRPFGVSFFKVCGCGVATAIFERLKRSSSFVTRSFSILFFSFLLFYTFSFFLFPTLYHSLYLPAVTPSHPSSLFSLHSYDFDCYPFDTHTIAPLHSPVRKFPLSLSLSFTNILCGQTSELYTTATIHYNNNNHRLHFFHFNKLLQTSHFL